MQLSLLNLYTSLYKPHLNRDFGNSYGWTVNQPCFKKWTLLKHVKATNRNTRHGPHSSSKEGHLHVRQQHGGGGCGVFATSVTRQI